MATNSLRMLSLAGVLASVVAVSPASAVLINTAFNFVPTGTLTANTGDVTTAATITPGAPDLVTSIVTDNTGLISGVTIVSLTSPTPVTAGSTFTKSWTTALGTFTETLTVNLVTPGPTSLGVTAIGTITSTNPLFDPTPVFYSAAYTQNGGPGQQINASFNDSTVAIPGPIAGAGLPGLMAACGALVAFARRRRKALA